jgi:cytochrome c
MKRVILSFGIGLLLASCGGNADDKKTESDKKEATTTDITKDPAYEKGLGLIAKSDCLTCHKIDEVLTGPSYRDVANKYAGMSDTIITHLAGKILKGGNGVWGEIAMTPHPAMSQEDAEAMVKYIMLLKK